VIELTHTGLNLRFDMGVAFTANYSFSGKRQLGLLNVLIRIGYVLIKVNAHTCIKIYVYTVFLTERNAAELLQVRDG
jgi:hypothetical protein